MTGYWMRTLLAIAATATAGAACAAGPFGGAALYQMHCAGCHGQRGEGVVPDAPRFQLGERLNQPDITLMQAVKMGNKTMPAFFGILKDNEILEVLAYVRTLR